MQRFIFLRVIQSIVALLVISAVVFALARVTGDPVAILLPEDASAAVVEQVREKWGLDQPIYVQYVRYIGNFVTGDFGEAWAYGGVPHHRADRPSSAQHHCAGRFRLGNQRCHCLAHRRDGGGQERLCF